MTEEKAAGWLSSLGALWSGESLESWIAKLIGVFLVLLVVAAIATSFQGQGARRAKAGAGNARPRLVARAAPSKNRKKKQDKIVRRYRPRSHDGKKPLRRSALAGPPGARAPAGKKPAGLWLSTPQR